MGKSGINLDDRRAPSPLPFIFTSLIPPPPPPPLTCYEYVDKFPRPTHDFPEYGYKHAELHPHSPRDGVGGGGENDDYGVSVEH